MTRFMLRWTGAAAIAVAGALLGTASAEEFYWVYGHTGEIRPADEGKAFADFSGTPTETHTASGIAFRLFYEDVRLNNGIGFAGANGAAARQRVRDVLDHLAATLNETGTLDIHFEVSQTDGSGSLASAGTLYSTGAGPNQPTSLLRILNGTKPAPSQPEIGVTVDFGFNYNFSANPSSVSQFDFFAVMLHEFTHGLGFASVTSSTGVSQFSISPNTGSPNARTPFDMFIVRNQGGNNIISPTGAFVGAVGDLTSNSLFFEGTQATSLYAQSGTQPGIYAPGTFSSGSSLSHWNTGNIVGGAIMEHAIPPGTDKREFAPVDVGGLVDIGWASAAVIPEAEGEGEEEGEEEGPLTLSVANDGGASIVEEGGLISLSVSVSGGTPTGFQWTRNGVAIGGANAAAYENNNASLSDSGNYRVEVSSGAKAVTVSAPVGISVVPVGTLPAGGALGLAALAAACAFAGAIRVRRK